MKTFKADDVVTVAFKDQGSSNVYLVESDCGDTVLLRHPLFLECLLRFKKENVDLVAPNVKDSSERSLDFVNSNSECVDYNAHADFEAIGLYFVVRRKLTPRQKGILANICGTIAAAKLGNDVRAAMRLIEDNAAILDDFNSMWYRNFQNLFSGLQPVTSQKQRTAIFNMAGFVMAELRRPVAANGYN